MRPRCREHEASHCRAFRPEGRQVREANQPPGSRGGNSRWARSSACCRPTGLENPWLKDCHHGRPIEKRGKPQSPACSRRAFHPGSCAWGRPRVCATGRHGGDPRSARYARIGFRGNRRNPRRRKAPGADAQVSYWREYFSGCRKRSPGGRSGSGWWRRAPVPITARRANRPSSPGFVSCNPSRIGPPFGAGRPYSPAHGAGAHRCF